MSPAGGRPTREEVLDAFAVESDAGRTTLERYLLAYPEYAGDLIDLSRELSRKTVDEMAPLSAADEVLIDGAWAQHAAALPAGSAMAQLTADPFASLTVDEWRSVAAQLDVPRQVVTALRERKVLLISVPRPFFRRFADAVRTTVAQLQASWSVAAPAGARSYKAEGKPEPGEQVTLEQVLIEAGVPPEKRARLLAEED
jgi:hypothetical protein